MSLSDLQDIAELVWHPLRMRLTTHFPQAAFLYLLLLFLWLAWCVGREYGRTRAFTSFLFVSYSFLLFALLFLCRGHHENPFVAPWGDWFVRQNSKGEWELDCIYNLLAFLPFSFLCGLLRGKVFRSILVCGIVSCLFECLQAYFSVGAFQISDIVYNALSGGIGAGFYSAVCKCRCGKN